MSKYEILNWPENVNFLKNYWSIDEVGFIREKFHEFQFVLRAEDDSFETVFEQDLDGISQKHWTKTKAYAFALQRFRDDTGDKDAKFVRWCLLDRSDIPSKYDHFEINSYTIVSSKFYRIPEIISNIHFTRPEDGRKRKCDVLEDDLDLDLLNDLFASDEESDGAQGSI